MPRDDIVFKDLLNTFIGINNYKSIFQALRFHRRIFFKALWLGIVSVLQPIENVVMVCWTVHVIPRVLWKSRGQFDGSSKYKLDKKAMELLVPPPLVVDWFMFLHIFKTIHLLQTH
ncbi:hypothetical protein J1N35_011746 [Gossypium stocksii]|uniref:Uncharacterized protein n=1 Tax=Gossypium stocksii TaxID=47602 RepID=A0A9D3W425_9ROSI|nr:hypothetical protein J1N35_011746 [Gossypium stocksii]